jgi:hypothetical protein
LGRVGVVMGRPCCGAQACGVAGPVGQIFFFLLLLFLFLVSFIAFAFELQMSSNQFLKFSKI